MVIRAANPTDIEAIVRLVNTAYEVERFFVEGDRTNADEVRALISNGTILVAVDDDGAVVGSVFVEVDGEHGGFGMLAVSPAVQRAGLGHRLIAAAEAQAAARGAVVMAIRVVNLRADLLPRYARLGYVATGSEPYVPRPVLQPCHFIVMSKPLPPAEPSGAPSIQPFR